MSFLDSWDFAVLHKCIHKGENVKITKLSLAAIAAMTLTTGAMAEVTADFSGGVKLWYETADTDNGGNNGLFDQRASGFTAGDAAISLEAKGKAGVLGYGVKYTAVDTLGLENNVVSARRVTGGTQQGALGTTHWAEKAFITYKMGNTMAKVGRQHLNTPLAYTEKWNVAANSFDAVVLMNSDIENVTLVAAYVGKGNGSRFGGGGTGTLNTDAQFQEFGSATGLNGQGAYAFGALAKPMKNLGANAWYYNVLDIADAAWLDANYKVGGVGLQGIYAQMMPKGQTGTGDDTQAVAVKASTKVGAVSLLGAYSNISSKGSIPVANVATGFKKTKLPTAGVYNDGLIVAQPGAKSFKVKAGMPVGNFKLAAQYISATNDKTTAKDVDEFDFIAATKIADVNVKAIFVNRAFKNSVGAGGTVGNTDSNHVRIIAGINF